MQQHAPEALDLSRETAEDARRSTASTTRRPPTSAGGACWRGGCSNAACGSCRSGAGPAGRRNNWDNHTDILKELPPIAPLGGSARPRRCCRTCTTAGMLADTLVVWSTEFGRQPFTQGATGRDHNAGHVGRVAGRGRA